MESKSNLNGKSKKCLEILYTVGKEITNIINTLNKVEKLLKGIINTEKFENGYLNAGTKVTGDSKQKCMIDGVPKRIEFELNHLIFYIDFTLLAPENDGVNDIKGCMIYGVNRSTCFTKCIFPHKLNATVTCENCERVSRCDGLEDKPLIHKNLSIFADAWVRGPAESWGLEDDEAVDNIRRGNILYAIAQHEFDYAYLYELNSLADILMLVDEMEEFSRYGRQLQSRKYNDTTADTSISFKPAGLKRGQDVEFDIVYEVAKHLTDKDYFEFMKRKAERLNKIYSLGLFRGRDKEKYCTIKSLKMTAEKNSSKYFIQFSRTSKHKGFLPTAVIDGKSYNKGEYDLTSDDDKLTVHLKDEKILLDKWLENASIR